MIQQYSNPSVGAREATAPVPEVVAGEFVPYRGLDVHGVDADTRYAPVPGLDDTVNTEFERDKPSPDPVPVRVVNEGSRERRTYSTRVVFAYRPEDNQPVMVAGLREDRTKVVVYNRDTGGVNVALGESPQAVDQGGGIPLPSGNTKEEFTTETPVWAVIINTGLPAGTMCKLIVREEFSIPL